MSTDTEDDEAVVQRHSTAADAEPIKTTAPRSVFDWRPAGSTAPTPAFTEREPMAKTTTVAKPFTKLPAASTDSPQMQICKILAAYEGSMPGETLRKKLASLDDRQLSNALYNCQKANRIRRNGDAFEITRDGHSYVSLDGKFKAPAAATPVAKKPAAKKAKRAQAPKAAKKPKAKPTRSTALRVMPAPPPIARQGVQGVAPDRGHRAAALSLCRIQRRRLHARKERPADHAHGRRGAGHARAPGAF